MSSASRSAPGRRPLTVEPFDGSVTVRFWDAVLASTDEAKVLRLGDLEPMFFVPFEHIYFDYLQRTGDADGEPELGKASCWRASAMDRSADNFMWAYEAPEPPASAIVGHGTFDPKIARIEAVPAGGPQNRPARM